jgi:tryptophan synthase beta chain
VGGGSNFAGMFLPFVVDKIKGRKKDLRIINVEPTSCPTITKGVYAWDYGDVAGLAPIVMMYTLGHTFIPSSIHAGGLRYHGMGLIICTCTGWDCGSQGCSAAGNLCRRCTVLTHRGNHQRYGNQPCIRVTIDEALSARKPVRPRPSCWRIAVTATSTLAPTMPTCQ